MSNILLSGSAGGGKSQLARQIAQDNVEPTAIVDFQSIYVSMTGDIRDQNGRYPLREAALLPVVEYTRQAMITAAVNNDITVVATNSDGSPARRAQLLGLLGEGATEQIVDPGRSVVEARLSDATTGDLSSECNTAINRWYVNLRSAETRSCEIRLAGNTLRGTVLNYNELTYVDGRAESFMPGAFTPLGRVPLNLQHDTATEILPSGAFELIDSQERLEIRAELKPSSAFLRLVQRGALNGFSVEFFAQSEKRNGSTRVIEKAKLDAIGLVDVPQYRGSKAEVRANKPESDVWRFLL